MRHSRLETLTHFVHKNLLWFLLALYGVALVWPQPGLWIRSRTFGEMPWLDGSRITLSLPVLMLSFLLFNAGLGTRAKEISRLRQNPIPLVAGVLANILVPLAFILFFWGVSQSWHNRDELQNILVGLAMVAAMPIAGSSTAWSQNVNGNLALSLGLVFFSTALSPWSTALVLNSVGLITVGDYSEDLMELAKHSAGAFLTVSVVFPSLLGIAIRHMVGEGALKRLSPGLKLFNLVNLLLLSYSNAAVSLPQAFIKPDWDFLNLVILVSSSYCAIAFGAGWLIARQLKTTQPEQSALMFGLGMNNNGSGLVLSSLALADHPAVMLPIIFYNLAQQIFAGLIDAKVSHDNRIP